MKYSEGKLKSLIFRLNPHQVSYVDDGDIEDNAGLVDMYGNNVRVPRRIESYPGNNVTKLSTLVISTLS